VDVRLVHQALLGVVGARRGVLAADVGRRGLAHVVGQIGGQLAELLVAGDEVGFAVDLHEHAQGLAGIGPGGDDALVGAPVGLLGRGGQPLGAEVVDGLVHIAAALHEGLLAVHHAGGGFLAKLLHHRCSDFHIVSPKLRIPFLAKTQRRKEQLYFQLKKALRRKEYTFFVLSPVRFRRTRSFRFFRSRPSTPECNGLRQKHKIRLASLRLGAPIYASGCPGA